MSLLQPFLTSLKRLDTEALLDLRPAYPPVAVEIDRGQLALVRVRTQRRLPPVLEAFRVQLVPEHAAGSTMFRPNLGPVEDLAKALRELFAASGTKPGRVALVLPDNLAKVSIVTLPERPATRSLLREMLRFKLRRSVPFRLEDAVISSHALPGPGPELHLLVAVMMRSVVEQYEAAFEMIGARPGLVDLCTPSLFNLVRPALLQATASGSDAALLNCTRGYFTLIIVRADRAVFFRCKSYAAGEDDDTSGRLAVLGRELASSLSYYADKLGGAGVGTLFVRATAPGLDEVVPVLERVGIASVVAIDAASALASAAGGRLDPTEGQRLAPALGAAWGEERGVMRSLELNLASRPFRNNAPLWWAHGLMLAAVLLLTGWNVRTAVNASRDLKHLQSDIGSVERQLAELESREAAAVAGARVFDLKTLQFQADRANDIILRRGLSWTRLFNTLEKVVPYEVRMTTVRPVHGTERAAGSKTAVFEGVVPVDVEGIAQSFESFLELERSLIVDPHFAEVEPIRTETAIGQAEMKFQLRFLYDPDGRMNTDHPDIPHILEAARKAAEEGGEAPPDALKDLPR